MLIMTRTMVTLPLLWISTGAVAGERLFNSATAESVLAACQDESERQQGFCLGFIEALAVRLAETREFCSYWPVNVDPIIAEALNALAEAGKDAPAWKVIKRRLSQKHLPSCK